MSKLRSLIPNKLVNIGKHWPLAVMANVRYAFPSKKMVMIGVTGTDGKTTTVNMIYQILKTAGQKVAMVSTINAVIGARVLETGFHVTSPNPSMVQRIAHEAVLNGIQYLVLEVTSHSLEQYRFWGIKFDIGVITNITHEHLDYHGSFENYFKAKAKLIKDVRVAVLNRDEAHFEKLARLTRGRVVSFGLSSQADINPDSFGFELSLPGQFNLLNALAASATALSLEVDPGVIKEALSGFKSLKGRMEEVDNKKGLRIVVDYAHTPNGLEHALKALKKAGASLIAVFGSAGLRDVSKRAMMGEIATRLADKVVITAEDPRGLIDQINSQIMEGVKKAGGRLGENVFIVNDRARAIDLAINKLAKKGDTVGIFGKGHELSINLDGRVELPWSDQKAVQVALDEK